MSRFSKGESLALESSLQFYWIETKPREALGKHWGQLAGATHRLRFVVKMLTELLDRSEKPAIEDAVMILEYHAENYYSRVYEVRERAVGLAASICERKGLVGDLKRPEKRATALDLVQQSAPYLVEPLGRLLATLDGDVSLRNRHTHDTFLRLGIWTGNDVFDPIDALLDVHDEADERACLEGFLWAEGKKMAEEYREKAQRVIEAAFGILQGSKRSALGSISGGVS